MPVFKFLLQQPGGIGGERNCLAGECPKAECAGENVLHSMYDTLLV